MSRHEDEEQQVTETGAPRTRPSEIIVRGVLTLLLIGLIAWILLGNVSDLEAVGEALQGVSAQAGVLLIVMVLAVQCLIATQWALTVPGLGITRGLVAVEGSTAVSNTVPGPSGTATRLGMLRSWGFYTEEFARSWLFTSSLTNFMVIAGPIAGVLIAIAIGDASWQLLVLGLVAVALSVTAIVIVWMMVRREAFAYKVGAFGGRMVRWAQGVTHRRPSEHDFAEAAVSFRTGLLELWSHNGARIVAAVVAVYVGNGLILAVSMRAVGLGIDELPIGSIAVVYTVVRLLTIVNFTPGGVGVVEALYTAAFMVVTGGDYQSQIVAGIILFRGLTYAGPIIMGVIALLVWRFRRKWRVAAKPEPAAQAAVGATLAGREPPER
ncbi:MAG: YbhN family protein [Thermoleophilia bacterium]